MNIDKKYIIGFDLGGTKMLSAVFDSDLHIITTVKQKTSAEQGSDQVIKDIINTIKKSLNKANIAKKDVAVISLGVPGPLDSQNGIIVNASNLGFKNVPIAKILKKEFKVPVIIDNDVSVGTYGEFKNGAGIGYENIIGIFPGTGIGGGLVLNGKLYRGSNGNAGEIGHMIIQKDGPICSCGQQGCLEAMASKSSMAKDAVFFASIGQAPKIIKQTGTDYKKFKSSIFAIGLKNKNPSILQIIDQAAYNLGIGAANCVNIFNPDLIIFGGGVIEKLGDYMLSRIDKTMRKFARDFLVKNVKIAQAKLGDDAVIIGAAHLGIEFLK